MSDKKIEFYFDFLSPYSYLGWLEHKKIKGVEWIYKPVVMGVLFKHFEIKGPAEVIPKREFLFRQLLRKTSSEGIPFFTPATHPFNPLYALRVSTFAAAREKQFDVIDALWMAGWGTPGESKDLGDPDQVAEILNSSNLNGEKLIDLVSDRAVKSELKSNGAEAISKGVFGVPSFYTQDELFWGSDSVNSLTLFLSGKDNLDRELYKNLLAKIPRGI